MKKPLSLSSVNLLYLVVMVIALIAGSLVQAWDLTLGLIITEFIFILLPTVILLLARKIPLKEGLRLNRIRPSVAVLCILMGFSINLCSMVINLIMVKITGEPAIDLPVSLIPHDTIPLLCFFFALTCAAPICEEALFRGVVQQAYETRRSTFFAIALPALMFVVIHFRLAGLPGLIPVSFLLGYVAWRTRSIISTMLVHLGVNTFSAVIIAILLSGVVPANQEIQSIDYAKLISPAVITGISCISLFGLIVTAGLLFAFKKLQPPPLPVEKLNEPPRKWWAVYWPLGVASVIFVVISLIMATYKVG